MEKVYLGIPSYGGQIHEGILSAVLQCSGTGLIGGVEVASHSFLTQNFNHLYVKALNLRDQGITHFCMLHDDIVPEQLWLDKMMALMKEYGADMLSAIVPLKNHEGMTSTALDIPLGNGSDPFWRFKRLTMTEVYKDFAPTFTHEKLLLNTGLMLIDLRKPWVEKVCFRFDNEIVPWPEKPGKLLARAMSEDWLFSRDALGLGAKLFATREVKLVHVGKAAYSNAGPWGSKKEDTFP